MSTRNDIIRTLAEARPDRLDPDGRHGDPSAIMAHPQVHAARAVRRPSRRLVLAGLVPTVALVAAGAVLVTVSAGDPGSGTGGAPAIGGPATGPANPGPVPKTARDLLLVAADKSLANPAAGGRYWVRDEENGGVVTVGPAKRPYQIVQRTGLELWLPMTPDGGEVALFRALGAAPISAADKAAWKADGSPTSWTLLPPKDLPEAEPVVIEASPDPTQAGAPKKGAAKPAPREGGGQTGYFLAGGSVSAAELGALPTDPARLKSWLRDRQLKSEVELPTDYNLFMSGKSLVFDLPVSPQVRAAAYRMLADVDGATALGAVQDQRGRAGMAVAFARKGDGANWAQTRLVIDPQTGQALAEESWDLGRGKAPAATGTLLSYTLVVSSRYTDDAPPSARD